MNIIRIFSVIASVILCFLTTGVNTYSQNIFNQIPVDSTLFKRNDTTYNNALIQFNIEGYYESNVIHNEFTDKFIYGGKIENDLKDKVSNRLKSKNRFGEEFNYELKYYNLTDTLLKKSDWGYYVGFQKQQTVNSVFASDFFNLLFYGNAKYADETAAIGGTNFTSLNYNKITFGLYKMGKFSSVGLSIISGNRMDVLNLEKGNLYTHPDGQYIDFDYEMSIQRSDSNNREFLSFAGFGLGLDFSYRFDFKFNEKPMKFQFDVKDFGFISWTRSPSSYYNNNQIHFDGFELKDFFKEGSLGVNDIADSIVPTYQSNGFVKFLPMLFEIKSIVDLNREEKIQPLAGVRYRLNSNYIPLVYAGIHYKPTDNFYSSVALSYGGYTGVKLALGVTARLQHFYINLSSANLIGLLSKEAYGRGVNLSITSFF